MNQEPANPLLSADEQYYCYSCYVATLTGENACLDHDQAKRLHELGLIDLRDGPGEDTDEDAEFHFYMTGRGEAVAKQYRDSWDVRKTVSR